NERTALVIKSLRGEFKLKDLLSYTGMPKSTYMYWQKRLDRENPDKEIEDKILEIRETNKNYGYRRVVGELRNQGWAYQMKAYTYRLKEERIFQIVLVRETVMITLLWRTSLDYLNKKSIMLLLTIAMMSKN
ncbi:MAG: hypothetical protein N5839_05685, partial [Lactobacillus iners]|nr:hypothetical protein [Lactobacillus iners]